MKAHILTIGVEDYFQVAALRGAVQRKHWDRLEPRVEQNLDETLELLARFGARATFFVFGWIADRHPELVRRIVEGGHEVASHGYQPRSLRHLARSEFVEDLERAREAIEAAGSRPIVGYRAPSWIREEQRWILDVLAERGYAYDSSINPVLRRFAGSPELRGIHRHVPAGGGPGLWELPITTASVCGLRVAIAGGNYLRQLPHALLARAVASRSTDGADPVVFYFMSWELDRHQPRVGGISTLQRVRHYRNLAKTRTVLEDYFRRYRFQGIGDFLGLPRPAALAPSAPRAPEISAESAAAGGDEQAVSLVVPIFNERLNIAYLHRTLLALRRQLARAYRIHLLLVDDASTDGSWALLGEHFGAVADCTLVRHPRNLGVAAAILTGIRAAPTEAVCSIDCDCSYDPRDLAAMIPLLAEADLVTASPYHPDGAVLNVPRWRLLLSLTLSRLYSAVLDERIHTFTSCCRVYRKSRMEHIALRNPGFLGVAEMLLEVRRAGGRIVEYPATLESRLFGESKMKIARTIVGHLGLLRSLLVESGRARLARARR